MMGAERKANAAISVASPVGRRSEVGTIGEAAAIARLAATVADLKPGAPSPSDALAVPDSDERRRMAASSAPSPVMGTENQGEVISDPGLMRRSRAGAGQLKDEGQSETHRMAAHLILADRAYAYGRHIVAKDKGTKLGDVLAIDS
jgi:hypothetical protein